MRYEKIMKQLKSFNFTDAQRKKLTSIILKLDKEKQDILVSGDNIATINGQSLLNGGNISLIKTGIFSIVTELPTNNIDKDKVYLVPSTKTDNENRFFEYIYTDNGWEKLGEFKADVDLSPYAKALNLPKYVLGVNADRKKIVYIVNVGKSLYLHSEYLNLNTGETSYANSIIPLVTNTTDGLMSPSDKAKLDTIENSAQVNKIESVSVNGTSLEITNKGVNIPIHEYTAGDGIKLENGKFSLNPVDYAGDGTAWGGGVGYYFPIYNDGKLYSKISIFDIASMDDKFSNLGLLSKPDYNAFKAKQDALTEVQLNNINNAITSISINNIGQVNTNGAVNLTIPNASITENGLMSKEDKAKLDSQPTIKASNATGVTDNDYIVIKKSELNSILSRLSALENKA